MILDYIIATLATYRIARMLALEDGAFDLFLRIRERLSANPESWVARGINCPLCIGFWVALFIALLLPIASWQMLVLSWFAIAGMQAIVYLMVDGRIE